MVQSGSGQEYFLFTCFFSGTLLIMLLWISGGGSFELLGNDLRDCRCGIWSGSKHDDSSKFKLICPIVVSSVGGCSGFWIVAIAKLKDVIYNL